MPIPAYTPPITTGPSVCPSRSTVPFAETVRRFRRALGRRCAFRVRPRKYYGTIWISDCYTDHENPALFRQFEGPLMEGQAMRTMGKGLSKAQVSAGALAEAIERLSLNLHLEANRGRVPVYELTDDIRLAPADLPDDVIERVNDSADAARGISADLLLVDEFQDIAAGDLPVLQETLSHSTDGRTILTGTPKSIDNHLSAVFHQSTANEWTMTCEGCASGSS